MSAYPSCSLSVADHKARIRQLRYGLRQETKIYVFIRDGLCCRYCLSDASGQLTVDHLIPVSRGGGNGLENLVAACVSCNRIKGNGPIDAPRFVQRMRLVRRWRNYARRHSVKTLFFHMLCWRTTVLLLAYRQPFWVRYRWIRGFLETPKT